MLVFIDDDFVLSLHAFIHIQNLYIFLKRKDFVNLFKDFIDDSWQHWYYNRIASDYYYCPPFFVEKAALWKLFWKDLPKERQHLKNDNTALYISV